MSNLGLERKTSPRIAGNLELHWGWEKGDTWEPQAEAKVEQSKKKQKKAEESDEEEAGDEEKSTEEEEEDEYDTLLTQDLLKKGDLKPKKDHQKIGPKIQFFAML